MYVLGAKELLPYFLGDWQMQRQVSDYGDMEGKASFQPNHQNSQQLDYHEAVILPNSADSNPNAFRQYLYVITESGFDILFADGVSNGKLFLSFQFDQASTLTCHHLCIKDHYDAKFEFLSENEFTLSFKVVGPNKDYAIKTVFRRI